MTAASGPAADDQPAGLDGSPCRSGAKVPARFGTAGGTATPPKRFDLNLRLGRIPRLDLGRRRSALARIVR